jgi:MFS superfamily sulfate permease-like transporter
VENAEMLKEPRTVAESSGLSQFKSNWLLRSSKKCCSKLGTTISLFCIFSEQDLVPGFACFFGCLFYDLEVGIGIGVGLQILIILYQTARPSVNVQLMKVRSLEYLMHYKRAMLFFLSSYWFQVTEFFRSIVYKYLPSPPSFITSKLKNINAPNAQQIVTEMVKKMLF